MSWGQSNRPKVSNKLGGPNRFEGGNGDIQIRQTVFGPKLFAKLGGDWNSTFLSTEADVLSIRNNTGQKTISLNADGSASFGSSIDVGSYVKISGHRGLLDFAAGDSNISIGNALYRPMNELDDEDTNDDNIAIGDYCLSEADNATDNVAMGNGCMRYFGKDEATTAAALCGGNVAIGVDCLQGLDADTYTRGWDNVAIGYGAMKLSARYESSTPETGGDKVTECKENVAIGKYAGYRTSGSKGVFIGMNAGYGSNTGSGQGVNDSTFGYGNVAIGFDCLTGYSTGSYNTVIGYDAGDTIADGYFNIAIGWNSDCSGSLNRQIAIGRSAVTTGGWGIAIGDDISAAEEVIVMGNSGDYISIDFGDAEEAWAHTSDIRRKRNIQDDTLGLSFINNIKPRTFQMKLVSEWPSEWGIEDKEKDIEKVHHGFIAQEIKESLDKENCTTFGMWSETDKGMQRLSSGYLVMPLTKAVQELSAKIDTMQIEINNLKAE